MPDQRGPAEWATQLGGDLDTALDSLAVPAWILDRHGVIRWENSRAMECFGELYGRSYAEALPPEARPQVQLEVTKKLLGTARTSNYQTVFLRPSGERVPVEVHSVAINGDRIVGIFGIADTVGPPLPPKAAFDELTPRQHEVLAALARGASTAEIAETLRISTETVRNHIRGILLALRVRSRLEAILEAHRRGMVR